MPSRNNTNDVTTKFSYIKWLDLYKQEKPYQILIDLPNGVEETQRSNLVFEEGPEEVVQDVTGSEQSFSLDKNGFMFVKTALHLQKWQLMDRTVVENDYLPACEQVIRTYVDDVDEVFFYNWRTRTSGPSRMQGKVIDFNDPTTPLGPATQVHVDQSPASVIERVYKQLPDRAEELLKGRVRLINLWRPYNGRVVEYPLAVCDGSTLPYERLIEADRIRRTYTGCTMYAMHTERMHWYYKFEQDTDDLLIFKSFDSDSNVVPYAAHAAIMPAEANESLRPRESIEVRAVVFSYPKAEE